MEGSIFGIHKAEPSQQQPMVTPPLDMPRAQLSRQHVRALNAQFARSALFIPLPLLLLYISLSCK